MSAEGDRPDDVAVEIVGGTAEDADRLREVVAPVDERVDDLLLVHQDAALAVWR